MNKKLFTFIVFSVFIITLSNNIFAWAFNISYPEKYQNFITYKILNGQPIKYYIKDNTVKHYPISPKMYKSKQYFGEKPQISKDLSQQLTAEDREIKVKEAFEKGIKLWFDDTRRAIANAGRSSEFSDIKPYLSPNISFTKVSESNKADIIIEIKDYSQNTTNWEKENKIVTIYNFPIEQQARLVQFFLGLASEDSTKTSIPFSCYRNTPTFSKGHLTCNSVDGLINLIDFTLSKTQGWSDRAQNGWTTLCAGKKDQNNKPYFKFEYKNAQPVNITKMRTRCLYAFEEGKIEDVKCLDPFNFYKTQQTFNEDGLVKTMDYGMDHFTYDYSSTDKTIIVNSHSDDYTDDSRPFYKDYKIKREELFEKNQFYFKHADKETSVSLEGNDCKIKFSQQGKDTEYYTFKGSFFLEHYTFIDIAPHVPTIGIQYEPIGCSLYYNQDGRKIADIAYNQFEIPHNALKDFSDKYQLDKETEELFMKQLRKACTKPSSPELNYFREICNYFRKVDNYFNK